MKFTIIYGDIDISIRFYIWSGCVLVAPNCDNTKSVFRGRFSNAPPPHRNWHNHHMEARPQETHATKVWKNRKTADLGTIRWLVRYHNSSPSSSSLPPPTSYQSFYGSDSLSHRKGMHAGSAVTWLETITAWQSLIFFGICKFWFLGISATIWYQHNDFPIWWQFQPNWSEGLEWETHHRSGESSIIVGLVSSRMFALQFSNQALIKQFLF